MKTRYSRRPKSLISSFGAPTVTVATVVVVLLLLRFVFPGTLSALAEPFWNLGSASARIALPESEASLKAERDMLRAQVETLLAEKLALQVALEGATKVAEETGLPARVLARPPVTPYDVLIIAAGTDDMVRVGQSVYGPGGTPLGDVIEAGASRSKVLLYSAGSRETQGLIGEVPVTLVGKGSGAFYASLASDAAVIEGDIVTVEGLPIATVARVDKEVSSPEAVLRLRPVVNPFTLSWVRIDTSLP